MKREDIKMAKQVLRDAGIPVFMKDIKAVDIVKSCYAFGIPHTIAYRIQLFGGKTYEAIKETQKDGVYSIYSAGYNIVSCKEVE